MWSKAEKHLLEDNYIGSLVARYGHCKIKPRLKRYYFEDLVDSIVQQQLSMKAASSIFNKIKEKISSKDDLGKLDKHKWRVEKTIRVKLTPENILNLSDKELKECGLSKAKITYIKDLSEKVISDQLKIKTLDKLSDEEVIYKLVEVKGIGVWTAHMFLMFTLARPDVFPVGDLGLRKAFHKLMSSFGRKKVLNNNEMENFSVRWKPWRTIASWYIWKTLE